MSRVITIWSLILGVMFPLGAAEAQAFEWPWSQKPEARTSHELYPKPDGKSAKKIKKARKKKAKKVADKKNVRGNYKP